MATYTVKQGDTLSALAKQYNTTVDEIAKTNTIQNPNFITVGQNLQIPTVTGDANIPPNIPVAATSDVLKVDTTPPPTVPDASTIANGVLAGEQAKQAQAQRDADIIKNSYQQTAPIEQQNTTLADRVTSLYEKLGGKSARSQELSQQSGIPEINKNIDDLNVQIAKRAAQFQNEIAGLSGRGEGQTNAVVAAETERARRIAATELTGLQAIKAAYEGNLNRAKATVEEALKAEFEPIEAQINAAIFNLERNDKNLTLAEKRRAEQTAAELNQKKQEVEDAKQEKRDIFDLAISAVQNGADPATAEAMKNAKTKEEALSIGAKVLGNEFRIKEQQRQFENDLSLKKFALDEAATRASIANIQSQINERGASAQGYDPTEILAFAQQYAATGSIPTGLPKGSFGIVSEAAKELPKQEGALVSINTGITPTNLSAEQQKGIIAAQEALTKTLPELQRLFPKLYTGLVGGLAGKIYTTKDRQDYLTLRQEFLNKLLQARSGATVTPQEYDRYAQLLPTTFNQILGFGSDGSKKLSSLEKSLRATLDNQLSSNQVSIYGYSKVKIGNEEHKVGEILSNEFGRARVNPDGTLTLIPE